VDANVKSAREGSGQNFGLGFRSELKRDVDGPKKIQTEVSIRF
jgi:hypothetical protein